MFCPKCGFENPDEARFCGKCAAPMPAGPAAPVTPPVWGTVPAPGAATAVPSGLKVGIGVVSVLLPIVGFIMGIIYLVDQNPEKKSAGKLWLILACAGMVMYCMFSAALRSM